MPALYEVFSDARVMEYWSSAPLRDLTEAGALLREIHAHYAAGTLHQWGIARRSDDRVIGTCTLAAIVRDHKRAEIGFALGSAFWGEGYAREAVGALLRHAFETFGLHRIEADVDPANEPSIRCLEHFGFRREGHARERWHMNGRTCDSLLYGLLRSEYRR